jgi:glycosyltransferase involved in cell wall biosynthesis
MLPLLVYKELHVINECKYAKNEIYQDGLSKNVNRFVYAYTPYHLFPGGGERYLLMFAKTCQDLGFHVSVLVKEGNVISSGEGLGSLAKQMGIKLKPLPVYVIQRDIPPDNISVDIFFSLGNEKYPLMPGIGRKNIYMCQFPFDYNSNNHKTLRNLLTYDIVVLNSYFSSRWYARALAPMIANASYMLVNSLPKTRVIYPPVPICTNACGQLLPGSVNLNIVLIGRFFEGRQSKGHKDSIEIFNSIERAFPGALGSLTLAGAQMKGRIEDLDYTRDLKALNMSSKIRFLIDFSENELLDILQRAQILWHFTGFNGYHRDPASEEHFGISVVTAMSYGLVPIVFDGGAMREIISHGQNGFLCQTKRCIIKSTFRLTKPEVFERMSKKAIFSASKFSEARFHHDLSHLLQ